VCKWSLATDERYNDGISSGHMWDDKRTAQKHGGGMRRLLKQLGKRCKEGYLFSKGKETEGMCK